MTAIGFAVAPPARRPTGRVAERILRRLWTMKLGRAGFRDLENPENPDGPLSNMGMPRILSHMFERSRVPGGALERREMGAPDPDASARRYRQGLEDVAIVMETNAAYYRRLAALAWRFENETDRGIATALADGAGQRRIKAELHVSQRRIERVEKQIRIWMQEPTPTGEDEE